VTKISVNPTSRQFRTAFVRLLSDFAGEKGLSPRSARTGGKTGGQDNRPEADIFWMDRGRVAWKFQIMPGPHTRKGDSRTRKKLYADPRLPSGEILCVDSSGNLGRIDPAELLDFFEKHSATLDRELIDSLARALPPTPEHTSDLHFKGTVSKNHQFLKDHYSLRIRAESAAKPAPGRFLQLLCDPAPHMESPKYAPQPYDFGIMPKVRKAELLAKRPFLRRPFSLASYGPPVPRDDIKEVGRLGPQWLSLISWSEFEVIYRRVPGGPGTGALAAYKVGDEIDVIGPLGRGFNMQPRPEVALLVGGGIGATPMLYLAEELARNGVETLVFVGAVNKSRIPFRLHGAPKHRIPRLDRLGAKTIICTDDGSAGRRALVTDPVEEYLEKRDAPGAKIFACGPKPMLAALEGIATRGATPCEVLLEETMACGFGACISCVCGVKETGEKPHFTRVCTEGPAFDAKKVMWHA
jgi:dihydroorotate dehydrogenase electron transfer subunit